jgi:hypothetical protein
MSTIDDGGPAFPYLTASESGREVTTHEGEPGMSLRDYFAAKAMAGLIVNTTPDLAKGVSASHIAKAAYDLADAMLIARATGAEKPE